MPEDIESVLANIHLSSTEHLGLLWCCMQSSLLHTGVGHDLGDLISFEGSSDFLLESLLRTLGGEDAGQMPEIRIELSLPKLFLSFQFSLYLPFQAMM